MLLPLKNSYKKKLYKNSAPVIEASIRYAYPHLHHLWPPTQASEGTVLSFSPSEEHLHIQAVAKTNQRRPGNEGEWLA